MSIQKCDVVAWDNTRIWYRMVLLLERLSIAKSKVLLEEASRTSRQGVQNIVQSSHI